MKTEDFWAGVFGREYHARNRVEWKARIPFWESAIQYMQPNSVLDVGCGPGWNLRAIQAVDPNIDLFGVDVSPTAVEEARQHGLEVQCTGALGITGIHGTGSIDLVVTSGVLIHVAPDALEPTMRAIIDTSARYVLAIEYDSDDEEEVEYRGHKGKLWKRPFGRLYQALGLKLLSYGEAGGFDNCTYWLLDKEQA